METQHPHHIMEIIGAFLLVIRILMSSTLTVAISLFYTKITEDGDDKIENQIQELTKK